MNESMTSALIAHGPSKFEIELTRVFTASSDLVFNAWTQPMHLTHWWAPKGFSTPHCTVDLRVGGKLHYCMRTPAGQDIWGIGVYREIVRPERIVYADSFSDAQGNSVHPSHYGMSPDYPDETIVRVTLVERNGETTLNLCHSVELTVEEREATRNGWVEMLDRLAEQLQRD